MDLILVFKKIFFYFIICCVWCISFEYKRLMGASITSHRYAIKQLSSINLIFFRSYLILSKDLDCSHQSADVDSGDVRSFRITTTGFLWVILMSTSSSLRGFQNRFSFEEYHDYIRWPDLWLLFDSCRSVKIVCSVWVLIFFSVIYSVR